MIMPPDHTENLSSVRTGILIVLSNANRLRPFIYRESRVQTNDLRKAGLKITLPRMKILDILGTAQPRHMSAEDIYRHLLDTHEDIGLATVYRVLTQFEAAGLVARHHFEGATAVFELNEGEHHDHIVCVHCGKVEEFFDPEIERRQSEIAAERGFKIHDHALYIYATCQRGGCAETRAAVAASGDQAAAPLAVSKIPG